MQVEQRVRELGQKSYWEQFEQSPEFAVLFLPGDQFLAAALAERPDLLDAALKQRIVITTPSTLMALLKVIAYGWRQNAVTENAKEIRKTGEDVYRSLTTFVRHLQKVGDSLGKAVESYNASIGSLERNVMPKARRFPELGVTSDAPLPPIDPIEELVRKPAATPALESDEPDSPRTPS
jgi:DNA recombination protein RmuC